MTVRLLIRRMARNPRVRRLTTFAMLAVGAIWAQFFHERNNIRCEVVSYPSMGQRVPARLCLPKDGELLPAVVYLHALSGPWEEPPGLYAGLVRRGIAVLEPHYFALTPAPGPDATNFGHVYANRMDAAYREAAGVWPHVVADGVSFLQSHPRIDAKRIGVVGYSLGGAMALRTASADLPYKAVATLSAFVELDGFPLFSDFLSSDFPARAPSFPPTLIVHGEQDSAVPVSQAYEIRDTLRSAGRDPELQIYPLGDHSWGRFRGRDARKRIVDFFTRTLAE